MLTHPDPQIQVLFNDITEQRDVSMVKCANLQVQLVAAKAEIAELQAKIPVAVQNGVPNPDVVRLHEVQS